MNAVSELVTKWRDEADSNDSMRILETESLVLRRCANELESVMPKPHTEASSESIQHETVLHSQKEIKSALDFHKTVLLYFTDSQVPARVINVTNGEKAAVYVQHGKQFFWVRIGKSSVSRIVLHEMKLTTV